MNFFMKNKYFYWVFGTVVIIGSWLIFSNLIRQPIIQKEVFQEQEEVEEGLVLVIDNGKELKTFK